MSWSRSASSGKTWAAPPPEASRPRRGGQQVYDAAVVEEVELPAQLGVAVNIWLQNLNLRVDAVQRGYLTTRVMFPNIKQNIRTIGPLFSRNTCHREGVKKKRADKSP